MWKRDAFEIWVLMGGYLENGSKNIGPEDVDLIKLAQVMVQ
jgi:hypothetical protein